jgi:hypothetical protein
MKRRIVTYSIGSWIAAILAAMTGCSMCCGPHDFDYPTFGGKYERMDRAYGRVGSILSDPNAQFGVPADSAISGVPIQGDQREPIERPRRRMESLDELNNSADPEYKPELDSRPDTDAGPAPQPDDNGNETTVSDQHWRQRPMRRGRQWR